MQSQIYRILSERSNKPLRQIIKDTKRNDFYLDAIRAREYGLIDDVLGPMPVVGTSDERIAPGDDAMDRTPEAPRIEPTRILTTEAAARLNPPKDPS
jgi:hypothetical protein